MKLISILRSLVFCFVLSLLPVFAQAELLIEITQGSATAIPISIVPFANQTTRPLPVNISRVITDDLKISGKFNPLPTNKMLSLPSEGKNVFFRDWKLLGQNYLLIGKVQFSIVNQRFQVSYELYDVFQKKRLLGEVLSTNIGGLRKVAHMISDSVFETITGVKGIFNTKIAYVAWKRNHKKNKYQLLISDADGHNVKVLLDSSQPIMSPAWSPDGKSIAYVSFENGGSEVFSQQIETGKRRVISDKKGINSAPAWSPDGKSMLVTRSVDGNAELYLINLATLKGKRLTRNPSIDTEGSWSPNGKRIVFTSDRGGNAQVYIMPLKNLEAERVTFDGNYNSRPRFSKDGKSIFYVHREDGQFNIAKMDLLTGVQQVLTSTQFDDSPSLSPNGRMIIYGTERGGKDVLAAFSIDGTSRYFLPDRSGNVDDPAWSPYP